MRQQQIKAEMMQYLMSEAAAAGSTDEYKCAVRTSGHAGDNPEVAFMCLNTRKRTQLLISMKEVTDGGIADFAGQLGDLYQQLSAYM